MKLDKGKNYISFAQTCSARLLKVLKIELSYFVKSLTVVVLTMDLRFPIYFSVQLTLVVPNRGVGNSSKIQARKVVDEFPTLTNFPRR